VQFSTRRFGSRSGSIWLLRRRSQQSKKAAVVRRPLRIGTRNDRGRNPRPRRLFGLRLRGQHQAGRGCSLLGGRGCPAQCRLIPPLRGGLVWAGVGNKKSKRGRDGRDPIPQFHLQLRLASLRVATSLCPPPRLPQGPVSGTCA
jgi:hypothetical protein